MRYKITALLVAILLVFQVGPLEMKVFADQETVPGYNLAAQSDTLELHYNEKTGAIAVKDKRNGYTWYSAVPEETYPRQGLTKALNHSFNSLFLLTYAELNLNNAITKTDAVNVYNPKITAEKMNDGVRMTYDITSLCLQISIDFSLEGDTLVVSMPVKGIREGVGAADKVEEKVNVAKEFIAAAEKDIEKLLKYKSAAEVRGSVKKFKRELAEFKKTIYEVKDAIGIEYASAHSFTLLGNMQKTFMGGKGIEGIFYKLSKSSKIDDKSKKAYDDIYKKLVEQFEAARTACNLLKTIKVGGVVEIEVLPNLGAAADHEKGYVFYPDGSGAISYHKVNHGEVSDYFRKNVYSDETIDIDWERERDRSGIRRTMLPVYGIKKDSNAFIAAVTKGDSGSTISFYPSGYIVNLNRASASLLYRRPVEVSSLTGFNGSKVNNIISKQIMPADYELRFMFLVQEDADYSGMASRYRKYLLDSKQIAKSAVLEQGMPLGIDLLMGVKKKMLLFDRFITMTTFEDAAGIVGYLREQGVDNTLMNLHGWTEDGYNRYPSNSVPSRKLGGKDKLIRLSETAKENGVRLYLQDNYIEAYSAVKRFNYREMAQGSNLRIIKNMAGVIQLFSPLFAFKRFVDSALPDISSYGVSGVTFDRLGTFLYYDYTPDHKAERYETQDYWDKMLKASSNQLGGAASIGGNAYTLKNSQWLLNIPDGATRYLITDEEVPFYQIVVHGLIPYSSKPFNQFYDKQLEKLKAIEFGCIPHYKLTSEDTLRLKGTEYNTLFSSKFDDWKEEMIAVYKEFQHGLGDTAGEYITKHERLDTDLVRVRYSNGKTIYINYSEEDVKYQSYTVKAMDYLVVEQGG